MSRFVLDTSVALAWHFEDESNLFADAVLEALRTSPAVVPLMWRLEVANALLVAERRRRTTPAASRRFLGLLGSLDIRLDERSSDIRTEDWLDLARECQVAFYDASFLELAVREGLPLATLDQPLRRAARAHGVRLFAP